MWGAAYRTYMVMTDMVMTEWPPSTLLRTPLLGLDAPHGSSRSFSHS